MGIVEENRADPTSVGSILICVRHADHIAARGRCPKCNGFFCFPFLFRSLNDDGPNRQGLHGVLSARNDVWAGPMNSGRSLSIHPQRLLPRETSDGRFPPAPELLMVFSVSKSVASRGAHCVGLIDSSNAGGSGLYRSHFRKRVDSDHFRRTLGGSGIHQTRKNLVYRTVSKRKSTSRG